jgi:hypothetical protein
MNSYLDLDLQPICVDISISDRENESILLHDPIVQKGNCTPASTDEFPPDLFTQEQRLKGFVVIHFLVTLYVFYGFAVVCGEYFIPSVERMSEGKLQIR